MSLFNIFKRKPKILPSPPEPEMVDIGRVDYEIVHEDPDMVIPARTLYGHAYRDDFGLYIETANDRFVTKLQRINEVGFICIDDVLHPMSRILKINAKFSKYEVPLALEEGSEAHGPADV